MPQQPAAAAALIFSFVFPLDPSAIAITPISDFGVNVPVLWRRGFSFWKRAIVEAQPHHLISS
jgi:hypothetical protein